jgi:dTDP-4-dehydrorhamnose 3,5-epimerase
MNFIRTEIPDVVIIEPKVFGDTRGYFMESYRKDALEDFLGYEIAFCQDNESKNKKGVLRGLHYQLPPFAQTKLVRVIKGGVLDVAVDIRRDSPTFGNYVAVELNEINKRQLLIPRGFAHGFLTLEDETIFSYKVDSYYSAEHDRGIAYDDPAIGIEWPMPAKELILSDKDTRQPKLEESEELFDIGIDYYAG